MRYVIGILLMCHLLKPSIAYADNDAERMAHFAVGFGIAYASKDFYETIGLKKGPATILGVLTSVVVTTAKELSDPVMSKDDLKYGGLGAGAAGGFMITMDLLK